MVQERKPKKEAVLERSGRTESLLYVIGQFPAYEYMRYMKIPLRLTASREFYLVATSRLTRAF